MGIVLINLLWTHILWLDQLLHYIESFVRFLIHRKWSEVTTRPPRSVFTWGVGCPDPIVTLSDPRSGSVSI